MGLRGEVNKIINNRCVSMNGTLELNWWNIMSFDEFGNKGASGIYAFKAQLKHQTQKKKNMDFNCGNMILF